MKRFLFAFTMFFGSFSWLDATLPPLYQTAREIKAILANEELSHHLSSGEAIIQINKTEKGYEIITSQHRLTVDVIYQPASHPGPDPFKLVFYPTH